MSPALRRASFVRFGSWEFDQATGELFKGNTRVRLQEQPSLILAALVGNAGELVTREQLYRLLWGQDTHVDYDHALNMAVAKIRRVLNDSPEKPRYIETIPKRGYRFISQVEVTSPTADATPPAVRESPPLLEAPPATLLAEPEPGRLQPTRSVWYRAWIGAAAALMVMCGIALWRTGRGGPTPPPGAGPPARFSLEPPSLSGRSDGRATISPDGRYIVYVAGREDSRLWLRPISKPEFVPLTGCGKTAISSRVRNLISAESIRKTHCAA